MYFRLARSERVLYVAMNLITPFLLHFLCFSLHWDNVSFRDPRKNMQRWKNPGFQASYAIFSSFTWEEIIVD